MRRKSDFTLIELLAVIVILAIIILIVYPIVTNTISQARYGAFSSSKKGIERAAELYYASNADKVVWTNDVSYVEIGRLKEKGLLNKSIINLLNSMEISNDTKVLLYKDGKNIKYSLQLYNEDFFSWYQNEMINAVKKDKNNLPINIGDKKTVDLVDLMEKELVDELRLPLDLGSRCVGYVEVEKTSEKNYNYNAFVDCLTKASTFASHYVSYGGKYLDEFLDVKETSDGGYIAVGRSNSPTITKYGVGNNGKYDAIIVKFKANGEVEWSRNFGGSSDDIFYSVVEGTNGYVAVGRTHSSDVQGYKGGINDAIIVVYDKMGNVTYQRCYGSNNNYGTESFHDIIKDGNNYIIIGTIAGEGTDGDLEGVTGLVRASEGIILKLDLNFNLIWRNFFVGTYGEEFFKVIKDSKGNYVVVGRSSSNDYNMVGYGFKTPIYQYEAIVLKYDSNNGSLLKINSFQGMRSEIFADIVEVNDGYIVVGNSDSSDDDMEGINKVGNGYNDAIIVKYDYDFNLLWKKAFGGSDDEAFNGIEIINNKILAVGYSKSNDLDMSGLFKANEGYRNAILVKYSTQNGNILDKKVFRGSNSETFSQIIKLKNNHFIVAGSSYSNDKDLKSFNKGHQDSIIVKYDNNLNLIKDLQEPVVIIEKIKEIIPNYGTELSMRYNNIYTTNDPTIDLQNWCTTAIPYLTGNTSNYYYWCLEPFNSDDKKLLVEREVINGLKFYKNTNQYLISKPMDNSRNWILLFLHAGSSTGNTGVSNLKLHFSDNYTGHITDAIMKGYIEPLVIVNSQATTLRPVEMFPNVINIINENGNTGIASYPFLRILFKPKKANFIGVTFTSNTNSMGNDYLALYELRNFDMSITPTN